MRKPLLPKAITLCCLVVGCAAGLFFRGAIEPKLPTAPDVASYRATVSQWTVR